MRRGTDWKLTGSVAFVWKRKRFGRRRLHLLFVLSGRLNDSGRDASVHAAKSHEPGLLEPFDARLPSRTQAYDEGGGRASSRAVREGLSDDEAKRLERIAKTARQQFTRQLAGIPAPVADPPTPAQGSRVNESRCAAWSSPLFVATSPISSDSPGFQAWPRAARHWVTFSENVSVFSGLAG